MDLNNFHVLSLIRLQRVHEKLGTAVTEEVSLHYVRSVARGKDMYCISFRLPVEVAFAE